MYSQWIACLALGEFSALPDSRAASNHPTDTCLKSCSIYQTPRSRKFSYLVITTHPIQSNLSFFSHSTPTADRRQAVPCYKGPVSGSRIKITSTKRQRTEQVPSPNPSFTEKSALIPTSDWVRFFKCAPSRVCPPDLALFFECPALSPSPSIPMKAKALDSELRIVHNELGPFRSGLQC